MAKRQRRLPKAFERELAKLLGTLGFADYGRLLWDLADRPETPEPPQPAAAPRTAGFGDALYRQISDQARHEASVVAAGEANLRSLRAIPRDLVTWWGVSAAGLLAGFRDRPDVILLAGRLDPDLRATVTQLAEHLTRLGAASVLLIVTDEKRPQDDPLAEQADLRTLYWRDWCEDGQEFVPRFLAQAVHASGAAVVIALRSALAYEMLRRHGRALRTYHRLFAIVAVPADVAREAIGSGLSPTDVHNLRLVAPYAAPVTIREQDAALFRRQTIGLGDAGLHSLEARPDVFGTAFADQRSGTSRRVIGALLQGPGPRPPPAGLDASPRVGDVDVTVTIVLHRERELAVPALASLRDMVETARRGGLTVEACAVLDRPDDVTRDLVATHGAFLDGIAEVSFGDLPVTRNASARTARGRFLAFLDGDDLWGADWLLRCHRAATAHAGGPAIFHPEALLTFFGSDCDRRTPEGGLRTDVRSKFYVHRSSTDAGFEPRDLLLENLWSANAFAAKAIFDRFPYRPTDLATQAGIEDWRWNLETLAHGIDHLVVPDTVHIIRVKEDGSLGVEHETHGRLPMF